MNKLLILLYGLLLCISFVGCTYDKKVNEPKYESYGGRLFYVIDTDDYGYLIVDPETRVQYIQISTSQYARMITLVDADGKPILYEGSLEVE